MTLTVHTNQGNSNDVKKLYKLVSQLMGQTEDNPFTEEDDDTKLAEQFGDSTNSQQ